MNSVALIAGSLFGLIGMAGVLIGGIWLIVMAFRQSVLWGLGVLFLPLVNIVFTIKYWSNAQVPFILNFMGAIILGIASFYFQYI